MEHQLIAPEYQDITTSAKENTTYFFLEKILKARIALHCETGKHPSDEEVNMYLAGLLKSLIGLSDFIAQKPYISPFDFEVRHYLEDHPGNSNEYVVYKENADFGLMSIGVFVDFFHAGSYHHRILANQDPLGRIALYYHLAAQALDHIQRHTLGLSEAFTTMADNIREIIDILHTVSGEYFQMMERMSTGSLFHLERDLQTAALKQAYKDKLDEFLKHLSEYKAQPDDERKKVLFDDVAQLKALNPEFSGKIVE